MGSVIEYNDILLGSTKTKDIENFINEYRNDVDALKELIADYGDLNNFDSPIWVGFNSYTNSVIRCRFDKFDEFINKKMIFREDVDLIKCYALECVNEGLANTTIVFKVNNVYNLMESTNCFDENLITHEDNEIFLKKVFDKLSSKFDVNSITDYLEFLERIDCASEAQLLTLSYMQTNSFVSPSKDAVRELPSNSDIFSFDFYLNKFFKEETNDILIGLFMPVLLWWKITNVIPIRASEFAHTLPRDCNIIEDGKYYIKIDRIKVTNKRKQKKKQKATIPILSRLGITKDIYDLIEDYKQRTSSDTDTLSLLSYKAYKEFRRQYAVIRNEVRLNFHDINEHNTGRTRFVSSNLQLLIDLFYDDIIKERYNDTVINRHLRVGDTRHLAFCALMLQGVSPVEIAMLGGHTSIYSQDHYVGHSKYYIDSEILQYVSGISLGKEIASKTIKEIVFSMSWYPNKKLKECFPTKDGVGYCTGNILNGTDVCETNRCCAFCSKWWCPPTNESFVKLEDYIRTNSLEPLRQKLQEEEEFLKHLLRNAKVKNVAGLVELEKDYNEEIASQTKRIRCVADEILFLQKSLLELEREKSKKELR